MDSRKFNRDALHMMARDKAAKVAHEALFPIQSLRPHEMVAGVSILFATICSGVGIDPAEAHTMGLRMLTDEDYHKKANDSLQSLRDFAGIRIAGREGVSIA